MQGYFDNVLNFFRPFLVEGLKGNNYLKRAVITGIMKVAQESVFSSFNNSSVSTITSSAFSDKFGFSEEEVKEMLDYVGMRAHDRVEFSPPMRLLKSIKVPAGEW